MHIIGVPIFVDCCNEWKKERALSIFVCLVNDEDCGMSHMRVTYEMSQVKFPI